MTSHRFSAILVGISVMTWKDHLRSLRTWFRGSSKVHSPRSGLQKLPHRLPRAAVRACVFAIAYGVCPAAAQPHEPAPLVRALQAKGDQSAGALEQQARRLLQIAERDPVQDFSSLCLRVREKARVDHVPEQQTRAELLKLAQLSLDGRVYLDTALDRLQKRAPQTNTPNTLYIWGMALATWEEPADLQTCAVQRRTAQAIVTLRLLRDRFPKYEASRTLTALGLLYTRGHDYLRAQVSYGQAIELSLDTEQLGTLYANLGEVTMLSGDLERAVRHYERALHESHTPQERALALWGQAVALDRLGEHDAALKNARKAMALEGGHMRVLRAEGVFFEPAYEVYVYEALGHEAKAQEIPAYATFALSDAADAYRAYLDQARAALSGTFLESAQRDLARVEQLLESQSDPVQGTSGRRNTTADTLP